MVAALMEVNTVDTFLGWFVLLDLDNKQVRRSFHSGVFKRICVCMYQTKQELHTILAYANSNSYPWAHTALSKQKTILIWSSPYTYIGQ